ncbi:MAG: hypothetical protein V4582_17065 [Pseudomonadota bacterium]
MRTLFSISLVCIALSVVIAFGHPISASLLSLGVSHPAALRGLTALALGFVLFCLHRRIRRNTSQSKT